MDPLTLGVAVGAPILGGLIGKLFSAADDSERERLMQEAAAQYNIPLPQLKELAASEMNKVHVDPRVLRSQSGALDRYGDILASKGLDATSKAQLESVQRDNAQRERGARGAIMDQYAARNSGGSSGAELAAQLENGQGAAERNNQAGLGIAAMGQGRYMQALGGLDRLSGQMRSQDFGEQSDRARANDAIARFNQGLPQEQFGDQMALASGKANALTGQGNYLGQKSQSTRDTWGGVGSAVGEGAATYGMYDDWRKRPGGGR